MATYTIGHTARGYTLVRWVGGRPTVVGTYPTEAAAVGASLGAR